MELLSPAHRDMRLLGDNPRRFPATTIALLAAAALTPAGEALARDRWRPFRSHQAPSAIQIAEADTLVDPTAAFGDSLAPAVDGATPVVSLVPLGGDPWGSPAAVGWGSDDPANWSWQILPSGVIWQSYWAGVHEPRISGVWFGTDDDAQLDVALGGRASILRFGSSGPGRPKGVELQIEGAATPRLNLSHNWDVDAVDFRFGVPLVVGRDRWQGKFSYYHLSAHMGDEYAIREDALDERINFSRDSFVVGGAFLPRPAWRFYAEAGWAFYDDGGAEPWEFQFGVDVARPGPTGPWGTPFAAFNGHLRQEHDFGGNFVAQGGWLWRGDTAHTFRTGVHYFNGKSNQFEFYDEFEQQIGGGLWYDF